MPPFLYYTFWGNTVLEYLKFLVFLVAGVVAVKIIRHYFLKYLAAASKKTQTKLIDYLRTGIKKYVVPILYFVVIYLSTKIIAVGAGLSGVIEIAMAAVILIFGAMFASSAAVFLIDKFTESKISGSNQKAASRLIAAIAKALIWSIAFILFLDNIGIRISALLTGVGIGGIAVAFAAQAVMTDIFCYFSILFDKPYEIGDFLAVGDFMGTVEYIGVKSTRLRAVNGEQLIFPNSNLTGSRIQNFKTMEKRRVRFRLGLTYDTPADQLKKVPELFRSIISEIPDTLFDRAHFASYGPYSLDYEIVYFVLDSDYNKYMDINQAVFLRIKEEFEARGLQFAYPTQTVQIQKPDMLL